MIKAAENIAIDGTNFWAEIEPSSPGRVKREWLIRWWIEIMSDEENGSHYIMLDTGAITLRQALRKAQISVSNAIDVYELEIKEK